MKTTNNIDRRDFIKLIGASGIGLAVSPMISRYSLARTKFDDKPKTNIEDALKYPRNINSMPGKYPAKVVQIVDGNAVQDNHFNEDIIDEMIKKGITNLSGKQDYIDCWKEFFSPTDIIGLKVNPVAGKDLSTSLEVVKVIIKQLEEAGISKKNIVIWDRREFELYEVGFVEQNFPNIKITGTECKDDKGSFYNTEGKLYSEERIDKEWFYWADCEEKYDEETLPYMVNEGKYSYFTKIVTKEVDKIINVPILKNAGSSITLCLKNLAYGSITNTGRLHKSLWSETTAEVCAFPPLRDKVVLNIVDGIKGCFNGGPGADLKFITFFNTILMGTDPVAVDRIGYEIILKKRLEEKIQEKDNPKGRKFLELAANLKLGEAELEKIDLRII